MQLISPCKSMQVTLEVIIWVMGGYLSSPLLGWLACRPTVKHTRPHSTTRLGQVVVLSFRDIAYGKCGKPNLTETHT